MVLGSVIGSPVVLQFHGHLVFSHFYSNVIAIWIVKSRFPLLPPGTGHQCHWAGLSLASPHGLSSCPAPAHAGLLAEGSKQPATLWGNCQYSGQDDPEPRQPQDSGHHPCCVSLPAEAIYAMAGEAMSYDEDRHLVYNESRKGTICTSAFVMLWMRSA